MKMAAKSERSKQKFEDDMDRFILSVTREKPGFCCVRVCIVVRVYMLCFAGKDGGKVTTVVATPGQGPDRPQEVSYTDTKVIGNGSFGVVYQAKLCDTGEMVAIKKVLQDKRFKVSVCVQLIQKRLNFAVFFFQNRELQIMRRLEHCNIVKLKYFFYSSGDKVRIFVKFTVKITFKKSFV